MLDHDDQRVLDAINQIDVEPDDVTELRHELRIARQLELTDPLRLKPVMPNAYVLKASSAIHFGLPVLESRANRVHKRTMAGRLAVAERRRIDRAETFQLAEVAVPRALFTEILRLIEQLRPRPVPT